MTDKKHYRYEGQAEIHPKGLNEAAEKIEVTGYEFLVPCKVRTKIEKQESFQIVNVNIADRKVYDSSGNEWPEMLTDKFFMHIADSNTLPDDFYAADDETVEQAAEAKEDFEDVRGQQYGEVH